MSGNWECWKCGVSIAQLPRPLSRQAECPACHAWLHVCRMCRLHDPTLNRACREPDAEDVADKTHSNFCDYFKERELAYSSAVNEKAGDARARLGGLFGEVGAVPEDKADPARSKLDALFGNHSKRKD